MREFTQSGELTRAELQVLVERHLGPGMADLAKAGVVVAVIAAPSKDPKDGKAVVASTAPNVGATAEMFAHAAASIITGRSWEAGKGLA